ncbi:MAG: hypothetical protein K8I02_09200, partial [Candidatus Methylomirabilis sp.]|nr:hypothetical protein [Deltaproteobacteria bacterium]
MAEDEKERIPEKAEEAPRRKGEPYRYPLKRVHWRFPDPDYDGDIFIWDIDNTYIRTDFSSLTGLMRIPFESATDKVNVSGTAALLRELRRGSGKSNAKNPLYFISASPPQLAKVLEEKLELDNVEHEGITFKDQLSNLRRGSFRKLREQYGFKLSALLANRAKFPPKARETLFGDDSESDASIYSLYADICGGRLRAENLEATLANLGVGVEDVAYIVDLAEKLPDYDPVDKIYIHLEKKTPAKDFAVYGPRLVPTRDSFQTALALFADGRISLGGMVRVGEELLKDFGFSTLDLLRSVFDLYQRGILTAKQMVKLTPTLRTSELLPPEFAFEPLKGWDKAKEPEAVAEPPDRFRTPERFLT